MARTRSLKPTFFTDSDLASLSPLHRLAFQGLWCQADRDGRLEDKPRELKIQILPYDNCDFDALLDDLAKPKGDEPGFIQRYRVGSRRYIAITRWDHQNPHPQEKSQQIPKPPAWQLTGREMQRQVTAEPRLATGQSCGNGNGNGSLVLGSGNDAVEPVPRADARSAAPAAKAPDVIPLRPEIAFFAWASEQRLKKYPHAMPDPEPPGYVGWYLGALRAVGGNEQRLQGAWLKWLDDDWGRARKTPCPISAFIADRVWLQHVPGQAAEVEKPKPKFVPVAPKAVPA